MTDISDNLMGDSRLSDSVATNSDNITLETQYTDFETFKYT